MSVTWLTLHFERSEENDAAKANMCFMVVTLPTSHCERSEVNDVAPLNIPLREWSERQRAPGRQVLR